MQELRTRSANGLRPVYKPRATRTRLVCPICNGREHVEKISTVVRAGRGRLIWEDGEVAHYETELSELLSEPPAPKARPAYRAALEAVPALLVLGIILGVLSLLPQQDYVTVSAGAADVARNIGLAWFGLLIPAVIVVRYFQDRRELREELSTWLAARRRWTALYYCSQDDAVFGPGTRAVTPAEMRVLLFPRPAASEQQPPRALPRPLELREAE